MRFLPLLFILLLSCRGDHSNEMRRDFRATIETMNGNDKDVDYRSLSKMKIVLFKVLNENSYFELNSSDNPTVITDQWFYNHIVGDTVHFDYVKTKRFFSIKRDIPIKKDHPEDTLTREERLFGK